MIADGVLKTADLIEASVLSMHGITPSFEQGEEGQATFVFDLHDQDEEFIEQLLVDVRSSKCKVEPKRFAREMRVVRQALYDFLQVDRRQLRLRQG